MWVFLVTEVLFFGGLFATYSIYRGWYPEAFAAGSHELDVVLGDDQHRRAHHQQPDDGAGGSCRPNGQPKTADGVSDPDNGARRRCFSVSRAVEYEHKFVEHHVPGPGFEFEAEHFRHAQIFFSLYFVMTGLHACT